MNKVTLGLVIYIKDQSQVKIKDPAFSKCTQFGLGVLPTNLPEHYTPKNFLLSIDMGVNQPLFRSYPNRTTSDWLKPEAGRYESITVCLPIDLREILPHGGYGIVINQNNVYLEHCLALTDLYLTLQQMLIDVGIVFDALSIRFYGVDGTLLDESEYTGSDKYDMLLPSDLEKLRYPAAVVDALMAINDDKFAAVLQKGTYRWRQMFAFSLAPNELYNISVAFRGDILGFQAAMHNAILNRLGDLRIPIATRITKIFTDASFRGIPMDTRTQQQINSDRHHRPDFKFDTRPEVSPEIKPLPNQSVNTIVWNSDLVYRATAQITDMRFNEICRAPDEPAIDWEQVIGRIVMTLVMNLVSLSLYCILKIR